MKTPIFLTLIALFSINQCVAQSKGESSSFYKEVTDEAIKLFPQPAKRHVTAILPDSNFYKIDLLDQKGRLITQWKGVREKERFEMELPPSLPRGTYFLVFYSSASRKTKKILVH